MSLYYKPFNTERSLDKGNPLPHKVLPLEPHLKHFFSLHCKTVNLCHLLWVPYKMTQRKKFWKIGYLLNQVFQSHNCMSISYAHGYIAHIFLCIRQRNKTLLHVFWRRTVCFMQGQFLWTQWFPRQMGCAISPFIINTTSLLLHQGYSLVHRAVTEMGAGPGLLAGKGEMWASESPRTIPPGSRGLEKSRTASNGKSLMPHSWEKLALTPSSFSSVGFATLSHQAKKAALALPLFTFHCCLLCPL